MSTRPNLYDYLKILAIVTMIIDHLGYYFFPDAFWLRLIGRIAFPIFLFLVGFSNYYKWKRDIFIIAVIVQILIWIGYFVFDVGSFQFNILWAIIGVRLFLSFYSRHHTYGNLVLVTLVLFVLHFVIGGWIDYGILSWGIGLFGFLLRNSHNPNTNNELEGNDSRKNNPSSKSKGKKSKKNNINETDDYRFTYNMIYGIFILIIMFIYNNIIFGFGDLGSQKFMLRIHLAIYPLLLYTFFLLGQQNYHLSISEKPDKCILFISKNALLIYGIHILLLSVIKIIIIKM